MEIGFLGRRYLFQAPLNPQRPQLAADALRSASVIRQFLAA